ncbi:hypothetical protein F2P46_16040 [Massilia sp. CCM 8734]|nr:hypothetical protein [Massilia sp. CCM 8734]
MRVGDMRVGDMRVGDMRVGDMRVGDMRVGDMRVGDAWQARARREEAAWLAMQRRGYSEGIPRRHSLARRASSDSDLLG